VAADVFPRMGITGWTGVDLILITIAAISETAVVVGSGNGGGRRLELRMGCVSISPALSLRDRSVRVKLGDVVWIILKLLLGWIIRTLLRWWLVVAL